MTLTKQIGTIPKSTLSDSSHLAMHTEIYERIIFLNPAVLKLEGLTPSYQISLDCEINTILKAYSRISSKAFGKETYRLDSLLHTLENIEIQQSTKNLHSSDTNEYTVHVKTDVTKARKATDEIFELIVQRINALAVLEPSDTIILFIHTVNQVFRKYKDLVAAKECEMKTTSA